MYTPANDVAALIRIFSGTAGDILEIGCNRGVTTRALAEAFPDRLIHGIDCVRAPMDRAQQREELAEGGQIGEAALGLGNVRIWRGLSPAVQRRVERDLAGVRCIFVDGDHRASAVAADTLWAMDFLKRHAGGAGRAVIAWHDYYETAPAWCGVRHAVDALAVVPQSPLRGLKHEPGTWVAWAQV